MTTLQTLKTFSITFALAACASASTNANSDVVTPTGTGTVTVSGRVLASGGAPIQNARVYVPGTDAATRTDANGNYRLADVPDGPQQLVVRARGYAPARVDTKFSTKRSDRERNHVDVTLLTAGEAQSLATQQMQDSAGLARTGFLQREGSIQGAYFLTPAEISQTRATTVSDLFRQIPVLTETPGPTGTVLRGAQGCLNTYVDGLRWRPMFAGDLDAYVPVRDVVAAEVYPPGMTPPAPFARGTARLSCTTLAIWTRSSMG